MEFYSNRASFRSQNGGFSRVDNILLFLVEIFLVYITQIPVGLNEGYSLLCDLKTLKLLNCRIFSRFLVHNLVVINRNTARGNEKCCANTSPTRVLPRLFQVLPNSIECLKHDTKTEKMLSISFRRYYML